MTARACVISVRDAVKSYGSVVALDGVSLDLYEGEVLALLGDNGAGKSTLIKCLSGVHRLDSGTIVVDGQEVSFRTSKDAQQAGIESVYQDLALFDNLSAQANFFIRRELTWPRWAGPLGILLEKRMEKEWATQATRMQVKIKGSRRPLGLMSGGQRQVVAVARSVAFATRVVILDEPTAALGLRESKQVLELVTELPKLGVSVILISHNLAHVTQVADRAVVLRQGLKVGEEEALSVNQQRLVSLIVGADPGTG